MRAMLGPTIAAAVALGVGGWRARAGGAPPRTRITLWSPTGSTGGAAYGGSAPTGALVTARVEVDAAAGEARLAGVPADLDPASVAIADLTDPAAAISEQRFLPGAATPTELLARGVGAAVTVVTADGERAGVLRAVDDASVVVEVGAGATRRLELYARDGFVRAVRWAHPRDERPQLAWRTTTTRPGPHPHEVTYRTDGLTWTVDYRAVLADTGGALDLAARASIRNATATTFDDVALTLIAPAARGAGAGAAPPQRFAPSARVQLAAGETTTVDLTPPRVGVRTRPVVVVEGPLEQLDVTAGAVTDCSQSPTSEPGAAAWMLEVDTPGVALPDGKARLYRRRAGVLEPVSEEPLRTAPGVARVWMATAGELTVERSAASCNFDEARHQIREVVEVTLANAGAAPVEVVTRESMWRWLAWRIEREDHVGARAGLQLQEYRVRVPAAGSQHVSYTVVYAW